jgi:hypothetical protein
MMIKSNAHAEYSDESAPIQTGIQFTHAAIPKGLSKARAHFMPDDRIGT